MLEFGLFGVLALATHPILTILVLGFLVAPAFIIINGAFDPTTPRDEQQKCRIILIVSIIVILTLVETLS